MKKWLRKNSMLVLITIVFGTFLTGFIISCDNANKEALKNSSEIRAHLVERTIISGRAVEILEVDQHLYISTSQGGIIHLESCPCKN